MKTATGPDKGHSDALTGKLTLGAIARLDPETLLRENEAAEVLRLSERTLERWRSRGEGPKAKKIGARRVAYTVGSILEFAGVAA
ncbi:putative DNA-binding transcriptional regulator AlpA [Bradyrhizobium sp. LM6.10]